MKSGWLSTEKIVTYDIKGSVAKRGSCNVTAAGFEFYKGLRI